MPRDYQTTLRSVAMKATPKRLAILDILDGENAYVSPEEVWTRLRSRFSRIGLPTVYRNLEELAVAGVITKVIHPNRHLYYYYCANPDHHHHFICVSCRRVQDVGLCIGRELEEEVARRLEGRVLSHILQVDGLCRDCVGNESGGKR